MFESPGDHVTGNRLDLGSCVPTINTPYTTTLWSKHYASYMNFCYIHHGLVPQAHLQIVQQYLTGGIRLIRP